jgi:hypothetical protein
MAKHNEYAVGDEIDFLGEKAVVTGVSTNGGNPEYTVAIPTEGAERPVSIPPRVHPAAFTNGPVELAEANQVTYDEAAKSSEEADKALEAAADEEESDSDAETVKATDSANTVRAKTQAPDPAKAPAGNASAVAGTEKAAPSKK